jgi:hypothetical protein
MRNGYNFGNKSRALIRTRLREIGVTQTADGRWLLPECTVLPLPAPKFYAAARDEVPPPAAPRKRTTASSQLPRPAADPVEDYYPSPLIKLVARIFSL